MNFSEYYYGKLLKDVILFNKLSNGDFLQCSLEEKVKLVNLQIAIVGEELYEEYFKYYGKDDLETLDAISDVLFTCSYYEYMMQHISELEQESLEVSEYVNSHIDLNAMDMLSHGLELFYKTFSNLYDLDIVIEATDRVIENNMSKFTTDKEEAEKWESPKGENLNLSETVVNDVVYYCLKNENGKVRKKKGFKQVKLQDLVNKQNERINTLHEQSSEDAESTFEA